MNSEVMVKMVLSAWDMHVTRAGDLIKSLTDEQLSREIAPGKNTGTYLLGHLVVVHDSLNDILGLGPRAHADLEEVFIKQPDKSGLPMPEISVLRKYWDEVHQKLSSSLQLLQPDDFFKRHNSVSDEDFIKEPFRNKLNVLISRTNHLSYHFGQMMLLK